ncbi:hypothetical protein Ccrd_025451 [Cynara cardunculus var. scolymus]|uniref:Uncharacterized protein n=1 Tax=Cynara cardunculus var. scolymus TaxID=59895 RepID=A0A103X5L5_CYNCS|nr:hypothetical protein Ccrd_025451 [Cynara cardunculus var. scolymus]
MQAVGVGVGVGALLSYATGTFTGYLSIQSAHGLPSHPPGIVFSALHTALLHLKPDPNAICHTRSPFETRPFASAYDNSYHNELLDVFPNRCSVILDGSMCLSVRFKFFSISSSTALPPAWMQKCSNASLKSGIYGFTFIFNTFLFTSVTKNINCSENGSTRGPNVVIFVLSASPATAISSRASETPTIPLSSSLW